MIVFARLLVRLVGFLALVALAAAGIVLAVFCIGTGTSGPSLAHLAALVHLPEFRDTAGHWLGQLEAPGSTASIAGLCGLGAIAIGVVLLIGIFASRRERLVTLAQGERGTVAARRRPLAQAAGVLVDQARGVTDARVRVRPRRRGVGGRMRVRASRTRPSEPDQVRDAVREQLSGLTDAFKLRTRVDVPEHGRVQ
jgi:hypothetical protein